MYLHKKILLLAPTMFGLVLVVGLPIHAVTSLAVGSPQPAVVDDESGVVLLNGGVEPCDPVRGRSGAGLGCSVLAGGYILFRRGRVSLFRDLLIFFSGSHLTRPRDRGN